MRLDCAPASMTADERASELITILAQGTVRLLTSGKQSGQRALTAAAVQSDECAPRTIGVNTPR
jgi:hypothetical protein